MKLELNSENSRYLGNGVFAHTDPEENLWVVEYNGYVANQVCLDDDAFALLIRYRVEFARNVVEVLRSEQ